MLIAFRQELVGRRVAAQNRIRPRLAGAGLPVPAGTGRGPRPASPGSRGRPGR
jgi:hypothetical protein